MQRQSSVVRSRRRAASCTGSFSGARLAGFLAFAIIVLFGRLLAAIIELSGAAAAAGGTRGIEQLVKAGGLTVWLYWAGIVGGLLTYVLGGWLGARNEQKEPREVEKRAPVQTTLQPTY
jgi:hypothetical protein